MLRILANDAYHALSLDDLALVAHFFDASPNFHILSRVPFRLFSIRTP